MADADLVGLNTLARRHVKAGRFSYFAGPEADLLALAGACLPHARPGPRDGVVLVPVPVARFFSGVVRASERVGLAAAWTRRAEGEDPVSVVYAPDAAKPPAAAVELVLYRRDVLPAGKAATACDWEIVSINARATEGEEPPHFVSMARNLLGRPGGTAAAYTVDEFAKSILYWHRHVHAGPEADPLADPTLPPLTAGVNKSDRGSYQWVEVFCEDATFLPPAEHPEPVMPMFLARRWERLTPGRVPDDPAEWAKSILYWNRRPRRRPKRQD